MKAGVHVRDDGCGVLEGWLMHGVVLAATVTPRVTPGLAWRREGAREVRRRIVPPPRARCKAAVAASAASVASGSRRQAEE